jgi:glycosyltransferase involved in cell wall biosynthesis
MNSSRDKLTIIVPFGKKEYLTKYDFKNVRIRSLPPGYKYVNYLLVRTSLPIPIDLIYGKGTYIFPNYKNWYVPFSKSITFMHDVAFKIFPDTTHPKNLEYLKANFSRWIKRADKIIAISNQSASELAQYFPDAKSKIETIYLGVDANVYCPRPTKEVKAAIKEYGLSNDYFLTVGNIEPRKNVLRTLEAYERYVDETKSKTQLVLVGGDGWKNENIKDKIASLIAGGYSVYRPKKYVQDEHLPALYSGARATIHTAVHEGFGLPPLQSQACGTPVVVSNLAVFKETLNDKASIYIDPYDVMSIVRGMKKAGKMPSKVQVPKTDLTWDSTIKQLVKLAAIINKTNKY